MVDDADSRAFTPRRRTRRTLHADVRNSVAFAQDWACVGLLCGGKRKLPPQFHVHHVVAHSQGGSDSASNLQALCPTCHGIYTQREQPWLLLAHRVQRASSASDKLCIYCKRVFSTHFEAAHTARCSGTWREVPFHHYEALLDEIRCAERGPPDVAPHRFSATERRVWPSLS